MQSEHTTFVTFSLSCDLPASVVLVHCHSQMFSHGLMGLFRSTTPAPKCSQLPSSLAPDIVKHEHFTSLTASGFDEKPTLSKQRPLGIKKKCPFQNLSFRILFTCWFTGTVSLEIILILFAISALQIYHYSDLYLNTEMSASHYGWFIVCLACQIVNCMFLFPVSLFHPNISAISVSFISEWFKYAFISHLWNIKISRQRHFIFLGVLSPSSTSKEEHVQWLTNMTLFCRAGATSRFKHLRSCFESHYEHYVQPVLSQNLFEWKRNISSENPVSIKKQLISL